MYVAEVHHLSRIVPIQACAITGPSRAIAWAASSRSMLHLRLEISGEEHDEFALWAGYDRWCARTLAKDFLASVGTIRKGDVA